MLPNILGWTRRFGPVLFRLTGLVVGGYFVLLPASASLFAGKSDMYVGDGGVDPQSLAFHNNMIIVTARYRPWLLLFGAVYTPQLGVPEGMPLWVSWLERVVLPCLYIVTKSASRLITLEAWVFFALNGVCFYAFARATRFPAWLSILLGLCFAFNPYTRARADAHMILAAIYAMPLVFLGVHLAMDSIGATTVRARATKRVLAALCFVFAMFSAHYYIMALVLLSPCIVLYAVAVRPRGASRGQALLVLLVGASPAIAFLAWNIIMPVPPGSLAGAARAIPANTLDRIVYDLAARPLDYLGGDLRFGLDDWLPWRTAVNRAIALPNRTNSCEPVNGIRWSILALALLSFVQFGLARLGRRWPARERSQYIAIALFSVTAFALSMPPDFITIGGAEVGFTRLTFALVHNFRCPCRAGPFFHFGVLCMAGMFLARLVRDPTWRRWKTGVLAPACAGAFLVDYVPTGALYASPLRIPRLALEIGPGKCGTGV